jgi:hypothetical protein
MNPLLCIIGLILAIAFYAYWVNNNDDDYSIGTDSDNRDTFNSGDDSGDSSD